ncbi:major facilitator superfamily domain-containing protein [Podospora aff. communis PSN243]|uniref:Major facilitator superfamily domain-containing protein n=1 Tax=Podospora aff. communis PSN243 TaxID=3040156 RepID=A0AAV9G624_9PEZI|nr:major facilitator superfamily domain-containing protein [Podospora aff. communis PSN243]
MGATAKTVSDAAVVVNKLDGTEQSDTSRSIRAESDDEERKAFLASFSAEEDKAIRRKVDRRFLWLIGLIYILKNIDYQNAAAVKVLQVGQPTNVLVQLNMTPDEYNWVQSIYFISYIVFEVPSNLLLKRMTPRHWQTRIIFTWGAVLACHAAVKNKEGLYAARFFLGMAEAGMFPGITAQLCSWYRSDEMGKPIMWMFGFQNCSGIVGSLLAYGISYMDGVGGWSAWQWVYLLEGLFTVLFAAVVYFVLPDYPKSARSASWLTPREQEYLERRLSENAPRTDDAHFDKSEIIASLKDPRTYSFMISQVLINLGGYALTWQLPTVTTNLGFAGLPRNQLLNIPPAAASVLAIIFAGWFMKRAYLTRPAFIMWICSGALVFYIVLATSSNRYAIYIACTFGMMFYSVYFIPFWAWRSATLAGTTGTAFTLAFQSCVGQVGGVVGPQLFQSKYAYNGYKVPFAISAVAIGLGWLGSGVTWYLTRNVEYDVKRIRRLRIKAEKEGRIFAEEDIKVFEERTFYEGVAGKKANPGNIV